MQVVAQNGGGVRTVVVEVPVKKVPVSQLVMGLSSEEKVTQFLTKVKKSEEITQRYVTQWEKNVKESEVSPNAFFLLVQNVLMNTDCYEEGMELLKELLPDDTNLLEWIKMRFAQQKRREKLDKIIENEKEKLQKRFEEKKQEILKVVREAKGDFNQLTYQMDSETDKLKKAREDLSSEMEKLKTLTQKVEGVEIRGNIVLQQVLDTTAKV